jgi:integrase/recombinase XerD
MRTRDSFLSSIAAEIANYISLKKALGRSFKTSSTVLLKLDRFLCKIGKASPDLTAETFNQWCQTLESISSNTKLARMRVVRNFCLYRRRRNPTCFIPDPTQFPPARPRLQPYIFSDPEVARILSYGDRIPDSARSPMRGGSTRLAILLLYTGGLRLGELLRLTATDYDPSTQTLMIRASKFHKSRLLPLQSDVAMEIERYLKAFQSVRASLPVSVPLLWSSYCGGRAYSGTQLRKNLHILLNLAGIKKSNGRLPRIHDFRFSFAVNALLRWYRNGKDVQAKLPLLAAYMGHVSVLSTYYYLRFITPLATLASSAFAAHYGALIQEAEVEGMR